MAKIKINPNPMRRARDMEVIRKWYNEHVKDSILTPLLTVQLMYEFAVEQLHGYDATFYLLRQALEMPVGATPLQLLDEVKRLKKQEE